MLYGKPSGITSFSSLFTIKHALQTGKVGHTGTLDSFAEGLLVVCVGSLTRLVSHITAFDKEYEAIISFGTETDTLDPLGTIIKTAAKPTLSDFNKAIGEFTGSLMQSPPSYSAIHVNGKRASDLARSGKEFSIPERPINVYSATVIDVLLENELVCYAHVKFSVSKGTYIRCLARDIGYACGSAAHLIGLKRTRVGSFSLEHAVGTDLLEPFIISTVIKRDYKDNVQPKDIEKERRLEDEVAKKCFSMTPSLAEECGFENIFLKSEYISDFFNGKPLSSLFFLTEIRKNGSFAVFTEKNQFTGVIENNGKKMKYVYVIPKDIALA